MRAVLLGTGTPNCEPQKMGSSIAVSEGDSLLVVDAGPGVVRRLAEADLDLAKTTECLLTHLHSDHTAGLPDLFLSPVVLGRNKPLHLYGPPGTAQLGNGILSAYQADISERTEGLEPGDGSGYQMVTTEVNPGWSGRFGEMTATAFKANHGRWPALGYRIESQGKTVVLSGDTAPFDGIEEAYKGADVLIHEVYSNEGFDSRPEEWKRYHEACHTSTKQLAAIANVVKPILLVLTHQLYWGVSDEQLVEEIRQGYDGEIVSGYDLAAFDI